MVLRADQPLLLPDILGVWVPTALLRTAGQQPLGQFEQVSAECYQHNVPVDSALAVARGCPFRAAELKRKTTTAPGSSRASNLLVLC